jgi:hypothetical protein
MDSNDYQPSSFDCVLAVDALLHKKNYHNAFEDLKQPTNGKRLAFGYLSYDLKK